MPKVKERDEQEALKLDEDFKQILVHVRPHVLSLRSAEEAYLCKIWLDKLNSTISQRNLRNRYLFELARQLKAGTLGGIFKTQPPNDLLMPLSSSCHAVCTSSSLSELSDCSRRPTCLTPIESSERRNNLQNEIYNSESSTSVYIQRHDDDTLQRSDLKLCEHRIDVLTRALENLQLQNERLRQELMKNQEKTTDNEAFRLRNRVTQLKAQAQSQSLTCKVRALKRTIAKLKKLNNIIEHFYEKKLQRIIRNKNLEVKILQLQFQGQTSELCLSLCSEKQNEMHSLVKSLEEKYKALLAAADAAIEKQQREYLTVYFICCISSP
ncbi:hypothetical protein X777_09354 [Ooceraea biroi]|uniref:DUF4485 domain-containing protein n=1 Tax=Ooceraea biroi TaxID=2015173 RepID=A0A026X0X6_OOCBI|nr:hypothetical protein X777_09354 [Ooceraea biroi]